MKQTAIVGISAVAHSSRPIESLTLHKTTLYWISESAIFAARVVGNKKEKPKQIGQFADLHKLDVGNRYVYALSSDGLMGFPTEGGSKPRWLLRSWERRPYSGLARLGDFLYFISESPVPILLRFDESTSNIRPACTKLPSGVAELFADENHIYAQAADGVFRISIPCDRPELLDRASVHLAQTPTFLVERGQGVITTIRKSDGERRIVAQEREISAFATFAERLYYAIPDRHLLVSLDLKQHAGTESVVEGRVEDIEVGDWGMAWVRIVDKAYEIVAVPGNATSDETP